MYINERKQISEGHLIYALCSLNVVIDAFVALSSMQMTPCKSLCRALKTSSRLAKDDLFSRVARLITRCADRKWSSKKNLLSRSLMQIWKQLNDGNRSADAEYSNLNQMLDRLHFDDVRKSKQVEETSAVVLELLNIDPQIRALIAQHFTNTFNAQIFVPKSSRHPTMQCSIEVSCFELLNSFIGLAPENVRGKAFDPTDYTLSDVVLNALDAASTRIKQQVFDKYCDELQLDIKSHKIKLALTKLSVFNMISLHWHSKPSRSPNIMKFKRKMTSNAPVRLDHKHKLFGEVPAAQSEFAYHSWMLFPFQEILHSGMFRNRGHFHLRRPSLNKTHITCTDGNRVKEVKLYTAPETRQRWQISHIFIFAKELPTKHKDINRSLEAYRFRASALSTLNDGAIFTEHKVSYYIEYREKKVKFPNRKRCHVCHMCFELVIAV